MLGTIGLIGFVGSYVVGQNALALDLVHLTGLHHELIEVNPTEIVVIRSPRKQSRLLPPEANCAIVTTDGKFISVLETCEEVDRRLEQVR